MTRSQKYPLSEKRKSQNNDYTVVTFVVKCSYVHLHICMHIYVKMYISKNSLAIFIYEKRYEGREKAKYRFFKITSGAPTPIFESLTRILKD